MYRSAFFLPTTTPCNNTITDELTQHTALLASLETRATIRTRTTKPAAAIVQKQQPWQEQDTSAKWVNHVYHTWYMDTVNATKNHDHKIGQQARLPLDEVASVVSSHTIDW
jgi:hypothetical protein